ncbi:MAG: protocatechuate 3,4-dioxygenase subunit alpha [Solirubrobacteraceae bacterium]|jgi:protocatechuate 3,4-dioxygenase alpha subunit
MPGTTPSQTVGPYFAIGLPWPAGPFAVPPGTAGAITITGTVFDGAGDPIPDSLIEIWGADPDGHYADLWGQSGPSTREGFRGFARFGEEAGSGDFELVTLKPGPVHLADGHVLAPHLDVNVFARGMMRHVVTRMYFGDEERANAVDPILARVPAQRRDTLIAKPTDDGYRFDIRVQGPGETVFFAV